MASAPRPSRRHLLAGLMAGSVGQSVTGCGLIGPPPRQFTLTSVTNFPHAFSPVKWSVVVDEPTAARQIDTSRIALMRGPFQVEYYAAVECTKIPGRERCVGHATSDCRSRNHPAEDATPNPSRHRALPESDSNQFQINRDSHGCL